MGWEDADGYDALQVTGSLTFTPTPTHTHICLISRCQSLTHDLSQTHTRSDLGRQGHEYRFRVSGFGSLSNRHTDTYLGREGHGERERAREKERETSDAKDTERESERERETSGAKDTERERDKKRERDLGREGHGERGRPGGEETDPAARSCTARVTWSKLD